jgi:protein TonB
MTALAPSRIPQLSKLWPWMFGFALLAHVAGAAWLFAPPDMQSIKAGGGGRVLGQLSMTLASIPEPVAEPEPAPVPEPELVMPTKPKTIKPKPRKKPQPVRKPVERKVQKPVLRKPTPALTSEAEPSQMSRAAAPARGEGASAPTAGLGGRKDRTADDHVAYLVTLRARIEKQRRYPADARRGGVEGIATAAITIAADGSLASLTLTRSSGSFSLDRMAKRMVTRAAPFPPPPTAPYKLTLPIAFSLAR